VAGDVQIEEGIKDRDRDNRRRSHRTRLRLSLMVNTQMRDLNLEICTHGLGNRAHVLPYLQQATENGP
jgi:hypothetical protein